MAAHEPDKPAEEQHAAGQRAEQQPAQLQLLVFRHEQAEFSDGPRADAINQLRPVEQPVDGTVQKIAVAAGFNPADGRHAEEVAERYHEKQALAAAHVPLPTIDLLRLYLSIEGRASVILDEIEDLAQVYKFDLTEPLAALRHHTATLRALAPQCAVTFDAGFSPRLEYYTGIVFEMLGEDGAVLASGGQYDRLLQRLGSSVPVTAAGCAVWVDRVEQEMMGQ